LLCPSPSPGVFASGPRENVTSRFSFHAPPDE
jgi:hypothetical protein